MENQLDALIVQNEKNNKETNDNLEALIVQTGKLDNKPELEAIAKANINTKNVVKKGNKEIVQALKDLKPVEVKGINAGDLTTALLKLLKGEDGYTPVKGKDYKDGEKGEKGEPGKTPEKGKDYFTKKEIEEVIKSVVNRIPTPKDGYTPVKGKDYFDGKNGLDGDDAIVDYDLIIKEVVKKLPKVKKEKSKTVDEFVEELKGRLSYNDLKDLPEYFRQAARDYDFLELKDAPKSYKGQKGKTVIVNQTEDGLEFGTGGSGGGVETVTGLNTDNTDPANPIVKIAVDGTTITGSGTPLDPLVSVGGGSGDMTKATYDPANGARQVAFASDLSNYSLTSHNHSGVYQPVGDYALNSSLSEYLKIDQTTPQTTVGRFNFPNIAVDTNTIYTDSVNHRVGIGTTSPGYKFDVDGKINANNDIGTNLGNYTKPSFIQNGSIIANAQGLNSSKGSFVGAVVQNVASAFGGHFLTWSNSTNPDWLIGLSKNVAGADAGNLYYMADSLAANVRLTIMKTGNIGIGTTAPLNKLHISDGTALNSLLAGSAPFLVATNATSSMRLVASENTGALSGYAVFTGLRTRGSNTSPTSPLANDAITALLSNAYDGTASGGGTAGVYFYAEQNVTAGVAPQRISFVTSETNNNNRIERLTIKANGNIGIGTTSPTAVLHLKAGSATAGTAPLKFTSGTLNTTAEAGAIEFLTDAYYGTITTGAARKQFAFTDSNITGTAANLSGTPALPNGTTATTQSANDNSTKLATTAYVDGKASGSALWTLMPGTPTRVSNTTFTVTGDITSYVAKGMIIKWTESSAVKCAMVSIPSTYGAPNTTITIIGDTMASIDASSLKYCMLGAETWDGIFKFATAGNIGATGTDIANATVAFEPYRLIGAEIWVGTAGTTNSTTIDLNINGTTAFTTKPTLATTVASCPTPFTADNGKSLALGDRVSMDIDAFQTTNAIDLYSKLYVIPTRYLNLA